MTILDHTRTLPLHVQPPVGWEAGRACDSTTAELFFAIGHDWNTIANKARARQAKAICAQCPVRAECLASAKAREDQWAIAGGLTPDERHGRR
jgi:WhiB family redox-sensing transcriptional regulator